MNDGLNEFVTHTQIDVFRLWIGLSRLQLLSVLILVLEPMTYSIALKL